METEKELGNPFPSLDQQLGKFPDRLRYAIGSMSIRNLAESAGVSDGTIHNLLNGGLPNLKNAASIADALKVRLEWLTYGEGPINKIPSDPVHGSFMKAIQNSESNPHPDEYAYIPLYNIEASAGHGSYVETEEVASRLAFRRNWLHQEVMANPAHLHLIYVRGDSMEPALQSGEVVMVDTSAANESIRDGIHVIQIDGAVLIKRLQRLPGNRVKVTSDNAIYAAFEADLNTAEIKIIGRVIWHAGRI
ncbi:MAG: S24 family peptidase [Halothiobacillus sp.]